MKEESSESLWTESKMLFKASTKYSKCQRRNSVQDLESKFFAISSANSLARESLVKTPVTNLRAD